MAKEDTQQTLKGTLDIITEMIQKMEKLPKDSVDRIGNLNHIIKEASLVGDTIKVFNESLAPGAIDAMKNLELQKGEINDIITFVNDVIAQNINVTKLKNFNLIFQDVTTLVTAINNLMMDLNAKLTNNETKRAQATMLLEQVDKLFKFLIDLDKYKNDAADKSKELASKITDVIKNIKKVDEKLTNANLKNTTKDLSGVVSIYKDINDILGSIEKISKRGVGKRKIKKLTKQLVGAVDSIVDCINEVGEKAEKAQKVAETKDAVKNIRTLVGDLDGLLGEFFKFNLLIVAFNILSPIILLNVTLFGLLFSFIIYSFAGSFAFAALMIHPLTKLLGASIKPFQEMVKDIKEIAATILDLNKSISSSIIKAIGLWLGLKILVHSVQWIVEAVASMMYGLLIGNVLGKILTKMEENIITMINFLKNIADATNSLAGPMLRLIVSGLFIWFGLKILKKLVSEMSETLLAIWICGKVLGLFNIEKITKTIVDAIANIKQLVEAFNGLTKEMVKFIVTSIIIKRQTRNLRQTITTFYREVIGMVLMNMLAVPFVALLPKLIETVNRAVKSIRNIAKAFNDLAGPLIKMTLLSMPIRFGMRSLRKTVFRFFAEAFRISFFAATWGNIINALMKAGGNVFSESIEGIREIAKALNSLTGTLMMSIVTSPFIRMGMHALRKSIWAVAKFGWTLLWNAILFNPASQGIFNGIYKSVDALLDGAKELTKSLSKFSTLGLKLAILSPFIKLSFRMLRKNVRRMLASVAGMARSIMFHRGSLTIFVMHAPFLILAIKASSILFKSMVKFGVTGIKALLFGSGKSFRRKFRIMTRNVSYMLRKIDRMVGPRFMKRLAKAILFIGAVVILTATIKAMAMLALVMTLATPILAAFVLISPIIILVFSAFVLILKVLMFIVTKLISVRMVIGIMLLAIVVTAFLLVAIELMVLAVVSIVLATLAKQLLIGIAVIFLAVVGILLIGAIAALALPLIVPIIFGLAAILIVIWMVTLSAIALWLLGKIELDPEAILRNVDVIFDTVMQILQRMMENWLPDQKDAGFWNGLLNILGKGVSMLLGVPFMVATFLVVVAITLTALMLRWLQTLKLDPIRIKQNVDLVFDVVRNILESLWDDGGIGNNGKKPDGVIDKLINWVSPKLYAVWSMLASAAMVVLALIAVGSILAIATILRLLQNLNLDKDKILKNVRGVFAVVWEILEAVNGTQENSMSGNDGGIVEAVIKWLSPGLASIWRVLTTTIFLLITVIAIGAVWGIAYMLKALQGVLEELDTKKLIGQIKELFEVIDTISDVITQTSQSAEKGDGLIEKILNWISPSISAIWRVLSATMYLIFVTIAIGAVYGIAKMLKEVESILNTLDSKQLIKSIQGMFDVVRTILELVSQEQEQSASGNGIWGSVIGFFLGDDFVALIDAFMTMAYVALTFFIIALVKGIALQLKEIAEIDTSVFETAVQNVQLLFECVDIIITRITRAQIESTTDGKSWFRSIMEHVPMFASINSIIDALMKVIYIALIIAIVGMIRIIADSLIYIAKMDTSVLDKAPKKVSQIMSAANKIKSAILQPESDPDSGGGQKWWEKALNFVKKLPGLGMILELAGTLRRFAIVGSAIAACAPLQSLANALNEVANFNVASSQAASKARAIVSASSAIKNSISKGDTKGFGDAANRYGDIANYMGRIQNDVKKAENALNDIGNFNLSSANNAVSKVKELFRKTRDLVSAIEGEQKKPGFRQTDNRLTTVVSSAVSKLGLINKQLMSLANGISKLSSYLVQIDRSARLYNSFRIVGSIRSTLSAIRYMTEQVNGYNLERGATTRFKLYDMISLVKVMFNLNEWMYLVVGQSEYLANKPMEVIDNLIAFIQHLDDIEISQETKDTTGLLMECLKSVSNTNINGRNYDKNIKRIDELNKRLRSIVKVTKADVKNAKDLTDNYIKFIDRVDAADLEKLKSTEHIMKWWAELSKSINGNFDQMAQAINENIMPMLKALDETMEGVSRVQQEIISYLSEDKTNSPNPTASVDLSPTPSSQDDGSNNDNTQTESIGSGGAPSQPVAPSTTNSTLSGTPATVATNKSTRSNHQNSNKPDGSQQNPFYVKISR